MLIQELKVIQGLKEPKELKELKVRVQGPKEPKEPKELKVQQEHKGQFKELKVQQEHKVI